MKFQNTHMHGSQWSKFVKPSIPIDECSNERENFHGMILFLLNNTTDKVYHGKIIKLRIGFMLREICSEARSREVVPLILQENGM